MEYIRYRVPAYSSQAAVEAIVPCGDLFEVAAFLHLVLYSRQMGEQL